MMPAEDPDIPDPLAVALDYAAHGLRVIPIAPGAKHPANIGRWQEAATTDPATIRAWWTELYRGHGVGIATGAESGVWVLDVDVSDGKHGDETLAALEAEHGPLPATHEVITGTGGRHIYFAWPPFGPDIYNDQSGRLGPGLDIRGEGGVVLAPPTIHPVTGRPYTIEASCPEWSYASAPGWLIHLLTDRPEPPRPPPSADVGDRPGDLWAARTSWADLLGADGWQLSHVDRNGEHHWTRPGKDPREGTSATTSYKGSDVLKVFTSTMAPTLAADATYTKIGYLAAVHHDGDISAAARWCRSQGHHTPPVDFADVIDGPHGPTGLGGDAADPGDTGSDWDPIDLTVILAGDLQAPRPTILVPTGADLGLLYPGRVNALFGESGSGKTWVELAAIAEVIRAGGHAVLIDLEDSAHGITTRLRALGLTDTQIVNGLAYIAPDTAWSSDAAGIVARIIDAHRTRLVAIDSTGEAMAAAGVKGNDDDDVARWFNRFPRWLSRLGDDGPAVVTLDHTPKDPNAPSSYAIGSQRKRAAVNGASHRIDAIKIPSRNNDGLLRLTCAKDRHGHHTQGQVSAMITIEHGHNAESVSITIRPPEPVSVNEEGRFRPTHLMERVSRYVELHPGQSKRDLTTEVRGKTSALLEAVDRLCEEGYMHSVDAQRGAVYVSDRRYREADETVAGLVDNPVDDES